jgi:hypothetical protein
MLINFATMKNILRYLVIVLCCVVVTNAVLAEEVHNQGGSKSTAIIKATAAGCAAGSNSKYLDINNVRAVIYSYGNGWFIENAEYEIPKGSKCTSMFSFSLWIGGVDINNNLKLAAYRYGQGPTTATSHTKNDFWPGPLTVDGTAAIDAETCANYDKLYPITRAEVQEFLAWWENNDAFPDYTIPKSILDWPGNGNKSKGQAYFLAPFQDVDGDLYYDPKKGDYPYYDLNNHLCPKNRKDSVPRIVRAKIKNGEKKNDVLIDTLGILVDQVLKGDQTLWCVYNDKGNYHSETTGEPIGMEIRAQYFAFATNDAINNMTFYSYELINRSTYTLTGTYFSQWVDPDLGYANDDYVGCDVNRGLGYCYNGTPVDGTSQSYAYGAHPPAVGVDFFQGPYMDNDEYDNPAFKGSTQFGPSFGGSCDIVGLNGTVIKMGYGLNGLDSANFMVRSEAINGINFGDGIVDNERYGMRRFVYHNNSNAGVPSYMTDPQYAPEYYLFLRGIWKDNSKMIYGGNGHFSAGGYGPACDFMFPDESDLCDWGTNGQPPNGAKKWTEVEAGNNPQDRRFMQSAGPFTLKPGACNYITVGIPWARSITGTPEESVKLLKEVDDKAQSLFDNCFAVLNGPNAPDLTIEEMSNSLIVYISNRRTNDAGNNFGEKYKEFDPNIPNPETLPHSQRNDSLYHFEGYQIYQLKDATVSSADLDDDSKARIVAQCDIKNGIKKLVNWTLDQNINGNVGKVMTQGADEGIVHSYVFTQDMFNTSDNKRLINHKQYYYMAVAYAYNQYKEYNQTNPLAQDGQKTPYLKGRSNIKVYTGIPHEPLGVIANSAYGDGPVITRIQGQGNGGMITDFSEASIAEILSKPPIDSNTTKLGDANYPICYHPTYLVSKGPLQIKVIDPLNVVNGEYTVKFDSMVEVKTNNPFANGVVKPDTKKIKFGKWSLINNKTGVVYRADTTTIYKYEQNFLDLGLALTICQVPNAGDSIRGDLGTGNGLLYASPQLYADSTRRWLGGVPDSDIPSSELNWIRSGTYKGSDARFYDFCMASNQAWDPNKNFQKIQNGTWAPYCLTATNSGVSGELYCGPAYNLQSKKAATLDNIASVDIVITPDKKLWTRCPVIELCPKTQLAEGGAKIFGFRAGASVNIDGDTGVVSSDPMYNSKYISASGMGWFPGYAINLETGERLNIMFGENSWLVADNGRDMLWNPSSRIYDASYTAVFGGQHNVYVMSHVELPEINGITLHFPAYDAGAYIMSQMNKVPESFYKMEVWASTMYVNIPLAIEGKEWLSNAVTTKIRVSKPYQRYYSTQMPSGSTDTVNRNYPMYTFNTNSIATSQDNHEVSVSQLSSINVVPNPYYAYNDYERDKLDNRIKIVNLPTKCTVTVFDMSGVLIRQFVVDKSGVSLPRSSTAGINTEAKTSLDWDLKNFAGIPIAGGVYLIHVKADGIGERTIKWFGILRPVDLNSL